MIREYVLYQRSITSKKNVLIVSSITLLYLLGSAALIGFKTDQVALAVLFNGLYYAGRPTRRFVLAFSVFIVFWIIFDSMKAFPNYRFNPIHVKELYTAEKAIFGMHDGDQLVTPNEYAQKHGNTFLDVMAGFFYLNWMPVPLVFGFYLFRKNRLQFLYFSLSFLLVNLLGFVVYYLYPAAPPWYVKEYGFDVRFDTPGNTAGLAKFDDFFGVSWFHALYAKSSNVFAAMPSLHSAYPVVVFYYGLRSRLGWVNSLLAVFMTGIWFSAVYTDHHYTLDVIAGASCALAGLFLFQRVLLKSDWFNRFLERYSAVISR